nr:AAA family ATPase [Kineosporia babensis]
MSPDDIVVTTRNLELYLGRVTGPAEYSEPPEGPVRLRRPVEWVNPQNPADVTGLSRSLQARLRTQQDVIELTQDLAEVLPLLETEVEVDPGVQEPPTAILNTAAEPLADRLLLPRPWLRELIEVLAERRQIVLYGPPGTGKTYLAKELAPYLTGDPQNVKLVQFHPAYSYEDFFEGFRPRAGAGGTMTFDLRPGPLRRLVDQARRDPGRPYVLIIDELNRANLASVFGELYFLLEHRDEAVELLYSAGESFTLPENVYLIGTMNTADRSVALVDAAMRRRFAFFGLHPQEEPVQGLLRRWLQDKGLPGTAADLLHTLNQRIDDYEAAIGPSYFMRTELYRGDDLAGLERVWSTSIIPLLEEYHYGQLSPVEVREQFSLKQMLSSP